MTDHYEIPKSSNMLSHLTNAQALRDYKRENARKLVKKQEELLRNLSKVRSEMEHEESDIGKVKDYYSGSRKDKFEHTLHLADQLKNRRFVDKEVDKIVKAASEEAKLPVLPTTYSTETRELHKVKDIGYKPIDIYSTNDGGLKLTDTYRAGNSYNRNQSEVQKLKDQVENIAHRYRYDTDNDERKFSLLEPEYYPGACYVKDIPQVDGSQSYVSGSDIAQYFPVTRYVLH